MISITDIIKNTIEACDALDSQAASSSTGLQLAMKNAAIKGRDFVQALARVKVYMPVPPKKK